MPHNKSVHKKTMNMKTEDYVCKFLVGDYSDFESFYEQTKRPIYFTALGILKDHGLAEDIMQDTFAAFLLGIDRVKPGENILAYLTVIARNKAINHYNKAARIEYNDEALANIAAEDNRADGVEEILSLLDDPEEREIVVYHIIIGYKFREIAGIMQKPLGTVLWRYNKAMKTLRRKVGESRDK